MQQYPTPYLGSCLLYASGAAGPCAAGSIVQPGPAAEAMAVSHPAAAGVATTG